MIASIAVVVSLWMWMWITFGFISQACFWVSDKWEEYNINALIFGYGGKVSDND